MLKLKNYIFILTVTFLNVFTTISNTYAETPSSDMQANTGFSSAIGEASRNVLEVFVNALSSVLFFKIAGFPVLVLWLVVGGIFFTVKLGFVNIRLFKHAIDVIRGKYSSPDDPGEVTHLQALTAAVSGTVGLGNIAGVAVAVSMGGPGAVIWMMIAGFFGMSAKFAEVTLAQKYRIIDEHGKVSGGAFQYLKEGLKERGMPQLGKALAVLFAILCICGSLGGGNMFQSNQTVAAIKGTFGVLNNLDWAIALALSVSVGIVLIGGIKRIAVVAEAIVPFMAFLYITASIVILVANADKIHDAVIFMFQDAASGVAVGGGIIGAIVNGFRRATFSNEAGLGSAPIAHSAAKTKEPVREGAVALLEPFIDTIVICTMTGLVITVTGVYKGHAGGEIEGVLLTQMAFETVSSWFPIVLSIAVALFAYSTMITWSYYGERSWTYLFGRKSVGLYHVIFCSVVFIGGVLNDIELVVNFSDLMMLSMAIPNLIGLYLLSGTIKKETDKYISKLKKGEFAINPGAEVIESPAAGSLINEVNSEAIKNKVPVI